MSRAEAIHPIALYVSTYRTDPEKARVLLDGGKLGDFDPDLLNAYRVFVGRRDFDEEKIHNFDWDMFVKKHVDKGGTFPDTKEYEQWIKGKRVNFNGDFEKFNNAKKFVEAQRKKRNDLKDGSPYSLETALLDYAYDVVTSKNQE